MPVFPANFNVTSLNGVGCFTITGFPAGGGGGYSVSGVGDINGDGIADLVIGAPSAFSYAGASYVIFGQSGIASRGSVNVTSLTGLNGFTITGFPANSYGGTSVSGAGDINGDGIGDLIAGAPYFSGNAGVSYVIFGKSGVGSSGSVSVASLTGSNGFVITGFPGNSGGGYSVSGMGDINGDRISDLVVGAPWAGAGASYVIFGHSGIGSSGSVNVASLTGSNGFVVTGFPTYSDGGGSVSGAGDINGDGISDLVVGAYSAFGGAGASYVIFGQSGIGNSGSISVTSLTGSNGFVITGFNGAGGSSVSGAGDINGDGIADLVVGAPSGAGASYVIFGQSGIGNSGSISVASLTGSNGFALIGFPSGSWGGYSVSGAGDINGDGIADLVVGAKFASSAAGASYVVFGQAGLGSSGRVNVTSLTGSDGFAITGFPANSEGGFSVSGVSDINGDGIADLAVGATGASGHTGASYVIFGEPPLLMLTKNSLSIKEGQTLVLGSQSLNATAHVSAKNSLMDMSLQFNLASIQHGRFFASSNPSISLTSFTQQQVRSSQIQFAHDGSGWAPAYNVSVSYKLATTPFRAAQITFQQSFVLVNNQLTISRGQTIILTSGDFSANDLYNVANNPNLVFTVSNVQHGYFALTSAPSTAITQFTQAQIQSGKVQFVQDGTGSSPSYSVAVINGAASIAAQPATISFSNSGLLLTKNSLIINQNQTVILTLNNINATDPYSARFNFTVSGIQHGYFSLITAPLHPINAFTPTQIQKGLVQFRQDGTANPPSYSVMASDGQSRSITQAASIIFDVFPTLITNTLTINQGQTVILTAADFNAIDSYNSANNPSLIFSVSNVQHGFFASTNAPSTPISQFTQTQIQSGKVIFTENGGINAPSFDVAVVNAAGSTLPQSATIYFQAIPTLLQNSLTINAEQSVLLTPFNLNATAPGNPLPSNLIFTVSDVTEGYFAYIDFPASPILSFSQADINGGQVEFVSTSSNQAPSYSIAVSDGTAAVSPVSGTITFGIAPQILVNQLTISQGGTQYLDLNHLHAQAPSATNSTLLFLVNAVHHGQFENYGQSGTSIGNFTQQQIINGNIQFVHDGSNYAPGYSITALNKFSFSGSSKKTSFYTFATNPVISDGTYSATSPAKIWFQAGGITLPQLKYNRLLITQGGKVILSSQDLLAIDIQGSPVFNTTFLISSLTHGQFTSVTNPITNYLNFSQSQVIAGNIQFIHDGGSQAPYYEIVVNQGPYYSAPYSASVAFRPTYTPPQTIGQLLDQTVTVNEAFSFPLETSAFSDKTPLHFSVSGIGSGQLPAWIHFNNISNYFSGTATAPGMTAIQVTAKDAAHLTASLTFSLIAQSQLQSQSHSISHNAIIGGVVGGTIGLLLIGMRLCLGRKGKRNLQKAIAEEIARKDLRSVANKIFEKVKLTGCFGYLSKSNAKAYVKAIENILSKFESIDETQQSEVANQIKKQANKSCCCSFFKPEITLQELTNKTEVIVQAVQRALSKPASQIELSSSEDVGVSDIRILSA